jgi:DNA-3-methyladenine glycosylase
MQRSFFTQNNAVNAAKSLIGKFLFSDIEGEVTGGMIVETEAYCEACDLAMQTHLQRRPSSIETLKSQGGIAYIYTVYGYHSMFNIVTNEAGNADSVLIRAIKPTVGVDVMKTRRGLNTPSNNLCSGPAKMSQALALTHKLNGVSVLGTLNNERSVWVEDRGFQITEEEIISSPRIGIDYAKQDAKLPWRFRLNPKSGSYKKAQ